MSKRHAPATLRNRDHIREVLKQYLPPTGTVLEIAAGTGEHAAWFAPALAPRRWLPTDIEDDQLASIAAWRAECGADNLLAPRRLDVLQRPWPPMIGTPAAIVAINLIHIAECAVTEALFAEAGQRLEPRGVLFLYGPFRRGGVHTAPSNEAFDARLRSENPEWGLRDMDDLERLGRDAGLAMLEPVAMPANNFCLIFEKRT